MGKGDSVDESKWVDLSDLLSDYIITSSAPCRLDCGGSTDHRLTVLTCRHWSPATVNIGMDLRTMVRLEPYIAGKIAVVSKAVGEQEICIPQIPLSGPLGLIFAILAYFGVHGVRVLIESQFPPHSGLGGSGVASVAVIAALFKAVSLLEERTYSHRDIVLLAHGIEDSLYGNTGLQDQAAAVFGGVNLWEWKFSTHLDFVCTRLICEPEELKKHIVLAYTGTNHPPTRHGSMVLEAFKQSGAIASMVKISEQARIFAKAIQSNNYKEAGRALSTEFSLRSMLLPNILPDEDKVLIEVASEMGCGAKLTGHGGGGCVWAIGEMNAIALTRKYWKDIFEQRGSGFLMPFSISQSGLSVCAVSS
jgi:D-glycero-alpha-D-manno-heptose-7-phosphate kinase